MCVCCNDTSTTEIYTLSLHDALPILRWSDGAPRRRGRHAAEREDDPKPALTRVPAAPATSAERSSSDPMTASRPVWVRSEEHTSELQSRQYLVCRLLLEKKKIIHPRA